VKKSQASASLLIEVGTQETGPPMSAPHDPPAWWADALITD
jgi:hypothetical protein